MTNSPFLQTVALFVVLVVLSGCTNHEHRTAGQIGAPSVKFVALDDVPETENRQPRLSAARNEWTSIVLRVSNLPKPDPRRAYSLRIGAARSNRGAIGVEHFSAHQIVSMPIDTNRAGYVRHTGQMATARRLPRALLPAAIENGAINLSSLRDPAQPTNPKSRAGNSVEPLLLWIDLHVPSESRAGEYFIECDLIERGLSRAISSANVNLTVHDFALSDQRHLQMVGELTWEGLVRHYAPLFEAVTPRLMRRGDERYAQAIAVLDEMMALAQRHRAQLVVSGLQPTVKWAPLRPPMVDWSDFDSIVSPWLSGEGFADKIPLSYWPMPSAEYLDRFDAKSQLAYWSEAAQHFDGKDWLNRSAVVLDNSEPGRASGADSLRYSALAADVLGVHSRMRVSVPLEEDQIQFASPSNPGLVAPDTASRLLTISPGLVFAPPIRAWPGNAPAAARSLRTDRPGLVPYVGAGGDERDVRLWAWLAFLRQAQQVMFDATLPKASAPSQPADPNDVIWFYPGEWFGLDKPVPTIQLKWVRRAEQDYEYLYLAKQRGELLNALVMARLMTKPVEIQPNQPADPSYALMSGTTDAKAWAEVIRLLARTILLRPPGQPADPALRHELNLQTVQWIKPHERPMMMARGANYWWDTLSNSSGGNWITADVALDIYNASDESPTDSLLQWTAMGRGWEMRPQPVQVPQLSMYHVRRSGMSARFNLDTLQNPPRNQPMEITFTHGFTQQPVKLTLMLPIASSDRREGALDINGSLEDWTSADSIHDGHLVRMLNRPALQKQTMEFAETPSSVYTGWADESFYVAFKLTGVTSGDQGMMRNFVEYQFRRAWGEDLCSILIQPVYVDNTLGPVLHVVCKPNSHWIERKLDPRLHADPWQPFEGTGLRYARTLDGEDWRGEVAIPWKVITDPDRGRPTLLRFNFIQHRHTTGESASWAGPLDFGRDDGFMGLLHIRELETPGMGAGR